VSFDLTILGSSSALPTSKRFPTAHLLKVDERFFLIDCGEGTQIQLRKFGLNPARIHHIFISHLHGDHVFGLFGLLSTMGMMGIKVPVNLYGPEHLKKMMEQHLTFFGSLPFELHFHFPVPGNEGIFFEDDKITVAAIPLKHRTQTFGYLFAEKKRLLNVRKEKIQEYKLGIADLVKVKQGEDIVTGEGKMIPNRKLTLPPYCQRTYAYISDTVYTPDLAEQVRGVDLLFHEATFAAKDEKLARETMHSTAQQAATIAKNAKVHKLLIGHFSSRYKDHSLLVSEARTVFKNTEGVNDGDVYSVPLERCSTE
jgi:ribonuclease Z